MTRFALLILAICGAASASGETFWGAGVQGLATNQPHPTGWAVTGTLLSPTQRIYSFSETDFTWVPPGTPGASPRIQTSARTGLATYLRSYGPLDLFAVADGGVATNGANTSGAAAVGVIGCFPLKKNSAFYAAAGYRAIKTNVGGTIQLIELGIIHRVKDSK